MSGFQDSPTPLRQRRAPDPLSTHQSSVSTAQCVTDTPITPPDRANTICRDISNPASEDADCGAMSSDSDPETDRDDTQTKLEVDEMASQVHDDREYEKHMAKLDEDLELARYLEEDGTSDDGIFNTPRSNMSLREGQRQISKYQNEIHSLKLLVTLLREQHGPEVVEQLQKQNKEFTRREHEFKKAKWEGRAR